jgi:alkaline phosphatase D
VKKLPILFLLVLVQFVVCSNSYAQTDLLQSGPMVGYSEMREVMLWVQTKQAAKVKIKYKEKGTISPVFETDELLTKKQNAFATHLLADEVLPGKTYEYELFINGKKQNFSYPLTFQSQTLWQHRTDPPNFKFAIGSCSYVSEERFDRPGKPYGEGYEIFTAIHKKQPNFMLWLGDNIYLREPDWGTRTGILHRYTHTRSLKELQPLLANTHHYAIWDDHDYGPNDSDKTFPYKKIAQEAFELFWANPNYNLTGQGGITGTFVWEDVQFFLLDNRYFRDPNSEKNVNKEMIGKVQIEWLRQSLLNSKSTFKFVVIGGQIVNPVDIYENHATYPAERENLLQMLEAINVSGIFILSGDRHHTELTKLERKGTYPLYDLTCSPLTAGLGKIDANNYLRVEGTAVQEKNFGMLEVSGERKERVLSISICNAKGEVIWNKSISAKELK